MADHDAKPHRAHPPPLFGRGPTMPRRSTPERSAAPRQHHRLARDSPAATRADSVVPCPTDLRSSNSSGESQVTGRTDPKKWFDRSNRNPVATLDPNRMDVDVDTPFFQRETDSSNEEVPDTRAIIRKPAFHLPSRSRQVSLLRPGIAHSSSADDYRSVIDDLTVENKRLKEELKKYKQAGPDVLRKDKLFEIKMHGLPKHKKRELEATLRAFAASLDGSIGASSSLRHQDSAGNVKDTDSGASKSTHSRPVDSAYASKSAHSRPVDSAYASMSTAPSSAAPKSFRAQLPNPSIGPRPHPSLSSADHQKVDGSRQDTPHGLLPRHVIMSDKERKKLVVRRLEQLFTGKISGRTVERSPSVQPADTPAQPDSTSSEPPKDPEAAREAHIQPLNYARKQGRRSGNCNSVSVAGDRTAESGGDGGRHDSGSGSGSGSGGGGSGGRSGSGNNTSPTTYLAPEQRATSALDLDPDRVQVPSENMDYIRHLGLDPNKAPGGKKARSQDVSPDADGWVYLNLLCNLAQLHMINVTPSFIRAAVSEKSAKFQLSPDGKKIRWRGGTDGTKFSSDSSGENSQKSPSIDDTDESNGAGGRKRQKTTTSGGVLTSVSSTTKDSKSGPNAGSGSFDNFHYKPIFAGQSSSNKTSFIESGSQASSVEMEESKLGKDSYWGFSGTGSSQRRKRRHDGAIIYYSGAPFCTDLSGDPVDLPSPTYPEPADQKERSRDLPIRPRTLSGSSIPIRPLSDDEEAVKAALGLNPLDIADDGDTDMVVIDSISDDGFDFPWSNEPDTATTRPMESVCLEASGLGGVVPDDHFAVAVTTRRPISSGGGGGVASMHAHRPDTPDAAESIARRLAGMTTTSPVPSDLQARGGARATATATNTATAPPVGIGYLSGRIRRLKPVPLPQPAMFLPPFRSDSDSDGEDDGLESGDEDDSDHDLVSEGLTSQRVNPHRSDVTYPDGHGLSSEDEAMEEDRDGNEEDEDEDDEAEEDDDEEEDEEEEEEESERSLISMED